MNNPKRWRRANLAAIRTAVTYAQQQGRMCAKNGNTIQETLELIPDGAHRTPYWRAFSRTLWATYFRTKYPLVSRRMIHTDARRIDAAGTFPTLAQIRAAWKASR